MRRREIYAYLQVEKYIVEVSLFNCGDIDLPEDVYEVASEGICERWFDERALLHCNHGPALRIMGANGELIGQVYLKNGLIHRDGDLPAIILRSDHITLDAWYQEGQLHRVGKPARIAGDTQCPALRSEHWYENGKEHRVGGAASTYWEANGVVSSEWWMIEGTPHRIGGPCHIQRNEDTGIVTEEAWQVYGVYHREDGPAYIGRDGKTGALNIEQFFLHGFEFARRDYRSNPLPLPPDLRPVAP